jgi:hypothetical protein
MAYAERDALTALGLDAGQQAFNLEAEQLREHVDAVLGPATALVGAPAAGEHPAE